MIMRFTVTELDQNNMEKRKKPKRKKRRRPKNFNSNNKKKRKQMTSLLSNQHKPKLPKSRKVQQLNNEQR